MRSFLTIAIGAAVLAATPLAASAQSQSGAMMGRPGDHPPASGQAHPGQGNPGQGHSGQDHSGKGASGKDHPDMNRPGAHDDYGRWDNGWGHRPPAPPKHYVKRGSWYQHVRACSARYRSYNPRTDTYQVRRGVYRTCRL